ncbi:tRNA epoxyqueuosine(34) reductase QueG, partial [bacterium]|nr:tRNA epoxyqueuosine(34) reductase QueG [bacterium]
MDAKALRENLRAEALSMGFDVFGVAPIGADVKADYFKKWIADGMHGEMEWMAKDTERRTEVTRVLPEARSIIVVGLNYYQPQPNPNYQIAKYALGQDYHNVITKKLRKLCTVMRALGGAQKPYVDTGPVLEKPIAVAAGLGWQGKSTIVLQPEFGTWLFLGIIITTLELESSSPAPDRCGSCTKCITACPTSAIIAPYKLDARKCLAYLTIEHKGPIPLEYRKALGTRIFGCDDCLDVCPWNKWAKETKENKFKARLQPALKETLSWTEEDFLNQFRGTPVKRLGLLRWWRNALTVMGNTGTPGDLEAIGRLVNHADPMVSEHACWARDQILS